MLVQARLPTTFMQFTNITKKLQLLNVSLKYKQCQVKQAFLNDQHARISSRLQTPQRLGHTSRIPKNCNIIEAVQSIIQSSVACHGTCPSTAYDWDMSVYELHEYGSSQMAILG